MAIQFLTQAQTEEVVKLYIAYFTRAPESSGLDFHVTQIISDVNGGKTFEESLVARANNFYDAGVSLSTYTGYTASMTAEAFIKIMYSNVLGRPGVGGDAPTASDISFWEGELNSGVSRGQLALKFLQAVETLKTQGNAEQRAVAEKVGAVLDNRVAVGLEFAKPENSGNLSDTAELFSRGKGALANVDDTSASVTTAIAAVKAASAAGNATSLTTGNDTFTGNSFDAKIDASGGGDGVETLNSGDNLTGSGTNPTLSVVLNGGQNTITPTLSGIETINTTFTNGSPTLDLSNATGVKTIHNTKSTANAFVDNVTMVADAKITVSDDNGKITGVRYTDASLAGSSDSVTIELSNSTGDLEILSTSSENIETANVVSGGTSGGANSGQLFVMGVETFNISGTVKLSISDQVSAKTVDAANFEAGLKATFGSGDKTVSTGEGEDELTFSNTGNITLNSGDGADKLVFGSTFDTGDSINGGGGKDTLVITSFSGSTTAANQTTSVEVLEATTASNGITASDYTTINEFVFSGGPFNGRVNIRGVENNDRIVFASDQGTSSDAVRFEADTAGTTATIELKASSGTDGEVQIVTNSNTNNSSALEFRSNISSVVLDSTGSNTEANIISATDSGSENYYAIKNNNGTSNFSITGSQDLTIGAVEGVALTSSSDHRGFSDGANVDASAFTGVLRIAGSGTNDAIKGGSAADIIYGLSGVDTLTGNGGADQFRYVGNFNQADVIKDFQTGTDKIGISTIDFSNTTATSAGASLSTSDYIDNRSGITSIGNADDKKVIELQTGLSTSQIQTDTGSAIEAFVLVYNTTTSKGELWYDNDWSTSSNRDKVVTFDETTSLVGVQDFSNTDFVEFVA